MNTPDASPSTHGLPAGVREAYDRHLSTLHTGARAWARRSVQERIDILDRIKDGLMEVADDWVDASCRGKQIPEGSPLRGEEWISGPYAFMATCNQLIATLSGMEDRAFLSSLPSRTLPNGQLAVAVAPHTVWDRLLLSGVRAEVWMAPGITRRDLPEHTASAYAVPPDDREGRVALVLGAGNINAIAPMDCLHKLFTELHVVLLKLNPINDYLAPFLEKAFAPLVQHGALRIVTGDGEAGAYLCEHPKVDEIHTTGSEHTHDLIVWGQGEEARRNRAAGTPRLHKRITSELGAVCPTIVVPGPWTEADLLFQAEQIATQKMHNSGFNCVACQTLVLPADWEHTDRLLQEVQRIIAHMPPRGLYYPGAAKRLEQFEKDARSVTSITRSGNQPFLLAEPPTPDAIEADDEEVFGPAMSVVRLPGTGEAFLKAAIAFSNDRLHGTLGANILIAPKTLEALGRDHFETLIADLRYGAIAVNAWTGLNFLMPQCTWGAFPGHTLDDVQSGIGVVHNTWMFDRPERTVVYAPFRPFPRNTLHGGLTLLPRPPWFITNRRAPQLGRLLTRFLYRPSPAKVPAIFAQALQG